jgi:hypothetical protein
MGIYRLEKRAQVCSASCSKISRCLVLLCFSSVPSYYHAKHVGLTQPFSFTTTNREATRNSTSVPLIFQLRNRLIQSVFLRPHPLNLLFPLSVPRNRRSLRAQLLNPMVFLSVWHRNHNSGTDVYGHVVIGVWMHIWRTAKL